MININFIYIKSMFPMYLGSLWFFKFWLYIFKNKDYYYFFFKLNIWKSVLIFKFLVKNF